jgi:hypothetical protein
MGDSVSIPSAASATLATTVARPRLPPAPAPPPTSVIPPALSAAEGNAVASSANGREGSLLFPPSPSNSPLPRQRIRRLNQPKPPEIVIPSGAGNLLFPLPPPQLQLHPPLHNLPPPNPMRPLHHSLSLPAQSKVEGPTPRHPPLLLNIQGAVHATNFFKINTYRPARIC